MKKTVITSLVIAIVVDLGVAFSNPEGTPDADRLFKFNIIGVSNLKNDMDQGAGGVIFVNLNGLSKISLVCSDDPLVRSLYPGLEAGEFDILNKDATDSDADDLDSGAVLALPDPDLAHYVVGEKGAADVWSAYSIYVRPLGRQGGYATITTCADVLEGPLAAWLARGDIKILNRAGAFGGYASIEQVGQPITERPEGKSVFTNVTAQLLTIVLKIEIRVEGVLVDTIYVRIPIFDDMLENEYWEYDNNGLKLLQVWIYNNETDVSADDETNYPGEFPE